MRTKGCGRVGALLGVVLAMTFVASGAAQAASAGTTFGAHWESWQARPDVADLASLQRGARDFVGYCLGCHSLRYERWSRLGKDLKIPPAVLKKDLIPPGQTPEGYIMSPMTADAAKWFGKQPPDLSLIARYRGANYLYRYLETFYVDSARPTGVNNLVYPSVAMPDVLSSLEGLKAAVYRTVEVPGPHGTTIKRRVFEHFRQVAPGSMTRAQFNQFVHDTVNFLVYVGDPARLDRHRLGLWVILFLILFTALAWRMYREYWKDVR